MSMSPEELKKKTEEALRHSFDTAENIMAKRYVPAWMFRMYRIQKAAVLWLASLLKYILGFAVMSVAFVIVIAYLTVRMFNRPARIKFCNQSGGFFGRIILFLSGSRVTVEGRKHLDGSRPALYITNHTSLLDIFLMMWLTPTGTCAVGKKEVIYYPLFGILYRLSGHLMIDRSNHEKAVASMKELEAYVRQEKLSVVIFPEGTRQRNGRLGVFKKGFVHMAIQTGLPIVPVIVSGAQKGWQARAKAISSADIHVTVLPAYNTSHWTVDDVDGAIDEMRALFAAYLPPDQCPKKDDGPEIIQLTPPAEESKAASGDIA